MQNALGSVRKCNTQTLKKSLVFCIKMCIYLFGTPCITFST